VDTVNEAIYSLGIPLVLQGAGVQNGGSMVGRWKKKYTNEAILEAFILAAKHKPTEPVSYMTKCLKIFGEKEPEPVERDVNNFGKRLQAYKAKGFWPTSWGPKPGDPECAIPQKILQQNGF
jgi:hypothetical protein